MNIIDGDLRVRGAIIPDSMAIPANSVGDTQFNSATPLTASKQVHQYVQKYAQDHGAVVATKTSGIHIAHGAGTITALVAALKTACIGAATVVVDLKKNGTTVLSGTITLDNSVAAYTSGTATVSSATYAAGDVFEIVVTATAGGGTIGQGLTVALTLRESAD